MVEHNLLFAALAVFPSAEPAPAGPHSQPQLSAAQIEECFARGSQICSDRPCLHAC